MSLRTNLATRPFYNERAVQVLLVIAAVAVAAISVFNARQLYAFTSKDRWMTPPSGRFLNVSSRACSRPAA